MDFIGEIIEHETEAPKEPTPKPTIGGFPELKKLKEKKVSRWRQKQQQEQSTTSPKTTEIRSEASKIHQENIEKMAQMSEEEILQEREELLKGLDPKLIESLIGRSKKREATDHEHNGHAHEHAEGYHGWIGSMKTSEGLTDLFQLDK